MDRKKRNVGYMIIDRVSHTWQANYSCLFFTITYLAYLFVLLATSAKTVKLLLTINVTNQTKHCNTL